MTDEAQAAINEREAYYNKVLERMKSKNTKKRNTIAIEQAIYADLVEACEGKCAKCQRVLRPTLDHIVPKQILEEMGFDTKREIMSGNYQILCSLCNNYKRARLDFSNPNTKRILLELLEQL